MFKKNYTVLSLITVAAVAAVIGCFVVATAILAVAVGLTMG